MSKNVKLLEACMAGNLEAVNKLLAEGANPNSLPTGKPYFGEHSPLTAAVQSGNLAVVQRLVAAGANIHRRTDSSLTPLFVAVRNHNLEIVQYLLSLGANPNDAPCLHSAVFHPDILRALINAGANIEIQEYYDLSTPLLLAAEHYQYESVKILLDAGANIDHVDRSGRTALSRAIDSRTGLIDEPKLKTITLLLRRSALPIPTLGTGISALHRTAASLAPRISASAAAAAWARRRRPVLARAALAAGGADGGSSAAPASGSAAPATGGAGGGGGGAAPAPRKQRGGTRRRRISRRRKISRRRS